MQVTEDRERKSPRVWYGPVTFAAVMAYLLFLAYYPQTAWGLWGLGFNELILLALALGGWKLSRRPFHEVFPFKKPTGHAIGGSLLVWGGAYFITMGLSVVLLSLFPEMNEVSEGINRLVSSEPFAARLLLVGVLPGVCEEAVHRGVVLSSLDRIRPVWPRIVIMGLFFGLFHTDIYRFIPTMVLGMAITYAMIKTNNLWMPILLHFINNALSVLAGASDTAADSETMAAAQEMIASQGRQLFVIYGGIGLLLLLFGIRKLNKKKEPLS